MFKRRDPAGERARHLIMMASVVDGLRREASGLIDEAVRGDFERLSDALRRTAFASAQARRG